MTFTPDTEPSYLLCDLFASLQGEATWTGLAMFFVRFSGCPLACPWCDEPRHRDPAAARPWTAPALVTALRQIDPLLSQVLLTGGEPLAAQSLDQLVDFLKDHGYWVAMETSGIGGIIPPGVDWVTLSPKTPLPEAVFHRANEIKYIVDGSPADRQAVEIQQRAQTHPNVWVQPRFEPGMAPSGASALNPQALQRCLDHIKQSGGRIRLSLQTHKWIGLP